MQSIAGGAIPLVMKNTKHIVCDIILGGYNNGNVITKMSKYGCFDSRYINEIETLYKDYIIMTYNQYKTGTNGKTYA